MALVSSRFLATALLGCLLAASGGAQSVMFTHVGNSSSTGWGFKVRALGDLDGDGVRDYFLGTRLLAKAEVRSGATGTVLYSYQYGSTCYSMACADMGDVNGDGVSDFAVGAPRDVSPTNKIGSVFMMSGADGTLLYKTFGVEVNGRFGLQLDPIGDVDGDGITDLLVGDIWANSQKIHGGSIVVVSGATGAHLYTNFGGANNDLYGYGVAAAGDLDLDGTPDYAAGGPREFTLLIIWPPGYVRTFSGATGVMLDEYPGVQNSDFFGLSVAGGHDLNADGVPDLVVGAPGHVTDGIKGGIVHALDGTSGGTLFRHGGLLNSQTGSYVRSMSDFDDDGTADILSGSCYGIAKIGETFDGEGYVEVLSGEDGTPLTVITGPTLTRFGRSVDEIGDLTGDGVTDFLVGAPETSELGEGTGTSFLYSGADLALTSDIHEVPWDVVVQQNLSIDAGSTHAGHAYFTLGSITGTSPGLPLASGWTIPLNMDFYFMFTLTSGNSPILTDFSGTLDAAGQAAPQFNIPAGILSSLAIGLTLQHAVVIRQGSQVVLITNPVPLTITD